jgi:hypothetical protein
MVERPGYEEGENGEKEPFDCGMHGLRRSSAESRRRGMGDLFEGGLPALVGVANGEVVAKRFVSVRLQFTFAVQPLYWS